MMTWRVCDWMHVAIRNILVVPYATTVNGVGFVLSGRTTCVHENCLPAPDIPGIAAWSPYHTLKCLLYECEVLLICPYVGDDPCGGSLLPLRESMVRVCGFREDPTSSSPPSP
ncbi:hypothetical protein L1987_41333 [Smallanthus sonchifolius]|uniref:Uncharacterized protein n=1 Tax=Smallanthus sonchifolius TaxID=185202 RepID=A0ACB9GUJ6_9ASTR|nr:hypothetical protein L1987_41333 [Smallanthus sonchifolius]